MTIHGQADARLWYFFGGVAAMLAMSTAVGRFLERRATRSEARATLGNMNARIRAWWPMCVLFGGAILGGELATLAFFAMVSFLALRELVTLLPTRSADHASLLWIFYIVTPVQYGLLAAGRLDWFTVFVPAVVLLLLPVRMVLAGDTERFLERAATIQWGVMLCVYALGHVPALLRLAPPGPPGTGLGLLVFLVAVVEVSDIAQYLWGKGLGRRRIAPLVSPNKTWAGFWGGIGSTTLVGAALWWITPFRPPQAAAMALVAALVGFAGGLVTSAIKRDRNVKDFGALIGAHGGVLDRVDALCFVAPVFYHLVRHLLPHAAP
jgi:phosphatidate cytidylyltransferase